MEDVITRHKTDINTTVVDKALAGGKPHKTSPVPAAPGMADEEGWTEVGGKKKKNLDPDTFWERVKFNTVPEYFIPLNQLITNNK
jgi:hypothetical protein